MTVEQESAQDSLVDKIAATVDTYVRLVSSGTGEQIADLFAAGGTVEDPIGTPVRTTREEIDTGVAALRARGVVILDVENWKLAEGDDVIFGSTITLNPPPA